MYEPDSYLPLSRLDADGESTEQGGLGTTQDAQQPQTSKIIAASAGQTSATGQKHPNYSQQPANDTLEASYWQALNPKGTAQSTGTDGPSANANLCEVYYFHTDQVGLPEELSNAQGQIIWQAQYKTWGSTVEERWEARRLHGAKVQGQTEGNIPQGDRQEQNLRFQGQYLDRETGLHYNTFRYYDADIGRFISPDPIGLEGGINLGSYSPNPISWIDPWGWASTGAVGEYDVHGEARVGRDMYRMSDYKHFQESNRQLYYQMKNDPALRAKIEAKYPGTYDHVSPGKRGAFSGKPPPNLTWHHHERVGGLLQLVDRNDHNSRHKDFHPSGKGGRGAWGGGSGCR